MDFTLDPVQQKALIAALSVISLISAFVLVFWPYLARNTLGTRIRRLADETERLRVRERSRLTAEERPHSLRKEPRKLFKKIVERFNLYQRASVGATGHKLRMAGYRGDAAIVTFLAIRIIAPFVMFLVSSLYVFVVLHMPEPPILKLGIIAASTGFGYFGPAIYVQNKITKRQQAIQRAWPNALDLMLICVESGMSIEASFRKVSEEIASESIELAEELALTTAELSYLQDRRQAFENLASRTGLESVRAVVTSLNQAEKHGTSVGRSLRVLSQESRDMRISLAEKKAAALPPKLTVPMILFFLPVLFAVIITPAAIQVMETH